MGNSLSLAGGLCLGLAQLDLQMCLSSNGVSPFPKRSPGFEGGVWDEPDLLQEAEAVEYILFLEGSSGFRPRRCFRLFILPVAFIEHHVQRVLSLTDIKHWKFLQGASGCERVTFYLSAWML